MIVLNREATGDAVRSAGKSVAGELEFMPVEIRGAGSLNGNSQPLFIVDGVPFPARIVSAAQAEGFKTPLNGF
jgi:hypothetical protein